MPEISAVLSDRLADAHVELKRLMIGGLRRDALDAMEALNTRSLIEKLRQTIHPMAVKAAHEFGLAAYVENPLSFSDLRRLYVSRAGG
ncbi:hypothetical protein [Geodermatophilus obscurus]|uniref:hypothetical protein n=1 Tax=Geodermatophilus obscurus TaxID=1861 RepID=UPI001140C496|nr:hypothetical protein [Geodermatophilus obscurus]